MAAYTFKRTPRFEADLKRLTRKFRRLEKDWERFVEVLCDRPWEIGDQFPGVHPPLSKARMAVPSAGLSKRDGCRVLYRIDEVRHVIYVARIYYKGERADVTQAELDQANREVRSLEEQEEFRGALKGQREKP